MLPLTLDTYQPATLLQGFRKPPPGASTNWLVLGVKARPFGSISSKLVAERKKPPDSIRSPGAF